MSGDTKRVLFIEDDLVDQMAFKRMVKSQKLAYDYTVAGSFAEARQILALDQDFDAIIMDYHLGDGNSLDLLDLFKLRDIPTIFATGTGDEETAVNALKSGVSDYLIKDPDRNYLKVLNSTLENAISHKNAENRVRMLSHAVMSTSEGIYITNMQHSIVFVNKAFCDLYGYAEKDVLGKHVEMLQSGDGGEGTGQHSVMLSDTAGQELELYHKRADGSELPVAISTSAIKDQHEQESSIITVVRDISERKKAEKAQEMLMRQIERGKKEWEATVDSFSELVFLLDSHGYIHRANRTVERWDLGRVTHAVDKNVHDLFHPDCNDPDCYLKSLWQNALESLQQGQFFDGEVWDPVLERHLYMQFHPILMHEQQELLAETSFTIMVVIDITKQKRIEGELRELNATKDKFFSIISHDLRSPFTHILGFSEMLIEDFEDLDAQQRIGFAETINRAAKNLYTLLENLLKWSRLQTGTMQLSPERLELFSLFDSALELLKMNAAKKKIDLVVDIDHDLTIYADRVMIGSVIQNLISNAIKFTEIGGTINLAAHVSDDAIQLSVADSGVGMRQDDVDKLFRSDTFHSTRGTRGEKGSGLGLILCKEFVERNGGNIWVDSRFGQGTTFTFTLPTQHSAQIEESQRER